MFPAICSNVFYFSSLSFASRHICLTAGERQMEKCFLRLNPPPSFMCRPRIYWHNLITGPSQNGINGR